MNRVGASRSLVNAAIVGVTIIAVALMLVVGRAAATPATVLVVGEPAPETYVATQFTQVFDEQATEDARDSAFNNVEAVYEIDPLAKSRVEGKIKQFFNDVRAAPLGPNPIILLDVSTTNPRATETPNQFQLVYTIAVENPSTRTRSYDLIVAERYADAVTIDGVEFDQDLTTDGIRERTSVEVADLAGPWVLVESSEPQAVGARATDTYSLMVTFTGDPEAATETASDCDLGDGETGTGLLAEAVAVAEDAPFSQSACRGLPVFVIVPPDTTPDDGESTTTTSTTTTTTEAPASNEAVTGTVPSTTVPQDVQIDAITAENAVYRDAIPTYVVIYDAHLAVVRDGGDGFFDQIEQQIINLAGDQLSEGIRQGDLQVVQNSILSSPPRIIVADLDAGQLDDLSEASATVLAQSLEVNELLNEAETRDLREAAAAAVADQTRQYAVGQEIVEAGQPIDAVQLEAIEFNGLLDSEPGTSRIAASVLGGLAVLLAALFLWRIAPARWSQPKHMALLGVLLVLAALIARLSEFIAVENAELAYAIPAAMLGYAAAILYDPRTALLTAVPMAIFTAIATLDPALTIYAAAATVAPVAFVSAVSTRRQLRLAVLLSALVLAPLSGAVSWLFNGIDSALPAALAGFAGGLIGGLMAQGLVSFLENLFQVTTTVTLLDLTDRNHPALRLIEERAPGTFNHSILVGTLAGKAARAIDADPLLAQAAAFYHDLGKTENPQYFIENQFGVSNPHDELAPTESAEIIRRHVIDGQRLARQYRIPPDVAAGVEQHHGTGLMRYFYHRAMEGDPSVDPTLFRHGGRKPQRKEMAILMVSDAVEGAARALAQQEDPTADSLEKLVDSIVGEKLEDGQFDESALTFGDLTRVKRALVEALIGYYHTRIPYPGFPGPRVEAT